MLLTDIISVLMNSLIAFSFLSLATFGIVLIFKTSSTTNFAQGSLGILGAYATSYFIDRQGVNDMLGFMQSSSKTLNIQMLLRNKSLPWA